MCAQSLPSVAGSFVALAKKDSEGGSEVEGSNGWVPAELGLQTGGVSIVFLSE